MGLGENKFIRTFNSKELFLVKIIVFCLFFGRGWQGLFWDLPLRTFFWDQSLLEELVTTLTGDTWQNYVTNKSFNVDLFINRLSISLGVFWMLCGGAALFLKDTWKVGKYLLYLGSFSFFLLALLYFKDKFWQVGQLFEYALQVTAPLVLAQILYGGLNTPRFRLNLKILIAITFICHGLYAYAYYPQPGIWIQWCIDVLCFKEDQTARQFLIVMGLLDFIAAALLFVPFKWISSVAIWYCIIWGVLTSLARLVGNFYIEIVWESLHHHAYQVLYRLVHGGIPLFLWWCSKREDLKV
jgi:hypothetical protein